MNLDAEKNLRASDGHHFLRNANRSAAHAHAQPIHTGIDQILGLSSSHHCTCEMKKRKASETVHIKFPPECRDAAAYHCRQ